MSEVILSDYFYGDESEQFIYFRIPRLLITSPRFKHLSTDAKLLYGMLLDRMSLSAKNNWYDEDGRVYIYYTVEEICGDMNCGRDKAMKLLAELDTGKGVGLIERIKQGQGIKIVPHLLTGVLNVIFQFTEVRFTVEPLVQCSHVVVHVYRLLCSNTQYRRTERIARPFAHSYQTVINFSAPLLRGSYHC